MSTMTLEQIQAERAAFEAWARREGYAVEAIDMRDDGTYHGIGARNAWTAWIARAHLAQPAQAVDVGAMVAALKLAKDTFAANGMDVRNVIEVIDRALSGEKAGPVGDGWQPIETARSDERIIGCWLGAPGCHEVDVAVYVTQGVDRPRWVAPDDSFCEYGKPDLWMPLPQPPGSSDGMDYPDGPWAEGWAERSSVLLTASPTPGKEECTCSPMQRAHGHHFGCPELHATPGKEG